MPRVSSMRATIVEFVAQHHSVRSRDIAALTGFSRQAIHRQFRALVNDGTLVAKGAGRGSYYVPSGDDASVFRYPLADLEEDQVWAELVQKPLFLSLPSSAKNVLSYAFTEILNNAIDHSLGDSVRVSIGQAGNSVWVCVQDNGVGAFQTVQDKFEFDDPMDALQEITKGKTTTQPEQHSGEGLFFVSKAVDVFSLESQGVMWLVDNIRDDMTATSSDIDEGTRARFELNPERARDLSELFEEFTTDLVFDKTRTVVHLFSVGVSFVSRSEAKRLLLNLDKFREVVLDFSKIEAIGQGFADEVFRVWANAHPETKLITEKAEANVQWMIDRVSRSVEGTR